MNKTIISILSAAILAGGITATAQGTRSESCDGQKCAKAYLPEAGDFAVGVDLVPLFRTIGGAFTKNDESTPIGGTPFNYDGMYSIRPDVSIMGKYMFTDKWGLKVNLGLKLRSQDERQYVADDRAVYLDPLSEAKVVDKKTWTRSGGSLMAGAEYRLGKRRVQGVFGAGVLFGFSTNNVKYSYGNEITSFNQQPSNSFSSASEALNLPDGYRLTEEHTQAPNFSAGIYGSVGAEWFVAPKISLGAEVDLYLYGTWTSQGYAKSEGFNQAYGRVENRTDIVTPGNRSIDFGTGNIGGSLYCTFYF